MSAAASPSPPPPAGPPSVWQATPHSPAIEEAETRLISFTLPRTDSNAAKTRSPDRDAFYANLYLSLWYEINGDAEESFKFISAATSLTYGRTNRDYMCSLARVHKASRAKMVQAASQR
eukprot:g20819.t1